MILQTQNVVDPAVKLDLEYIIGLIDHKNHPDAKDVVLQPGHRLHPTVCDRVVQPGPGLLQQKLVPISTFRKLPDAFGPEVGLIVLGQRGDGHFDGGEQDKFTVWLDGLVKPLDEVVVPAHIDAQPAVLLGIRADGLGDHRVLEARV